MTGGLFMSWPDCPPRCQVLAYEDLFKAFLAFDDDIRCVIFRSQPWERGSQGQLSVFRAMAPAGTSKARERTQSQIVPDLPARGSAGNRRERTQSQFVPDLQACGSNPKTARKNPKLICAGFAGTRVEREIGANEPKVNLCRICRHAKSARRTQRRSLWRLRN